MYLYGGRTLLNVSRVIVHPKFITAFLGFDLALLKLASPVRASHGVRPVTLPLRSLNFSPEDTCWLTGWGRGLYYGEKAWGWLLGPCCLAGGGALRGWLRSSETLGEERGPFTSTCVPGVGGHVAAWTF